MSGFPWWITGKEPTAYTGDGLIPGWGRSPEERNGNPLQYSCLGNPMDRDWSMGLQRVRDDFSTNITLRFCI